MTLWTYPTQLILASASATRRLMLEEVGIPVDVKIASIDERAVDGPLRAQLAAPDQIALALSEAKAQSVSRLHPDRLVLGADQILDCDQHVIDKAKNRVAAEEKLAFLAGRRHRLTSAASLVLNGELIFSCVSEAYLSLRPLDQEMIRLYADHAGPALTQSVGAYEIEGLGALLLSEIQGDHFTIRGLPLLALLSGFRQQGWLAL